MVVSDIAGVFAGAAPLSSIEGWIDAAIARVKSAIVLRSAPICLAIAEMGNPTAFSCAVSS
jgi:hypothetical protein